MHIRCIIKNRMLWKPLKITNHSSSKQSYILRYCMPLLFACYFLMIETLFLFRFIIFWFPWKFYGYLSQKPMLLYDSAILIRLYRIPAVATSIHPKPYQSTALQTPQSVTPSLYRTTLLVNKVTTIIRSIRK